MAENKMELEEFEFPDEVEIKKSSAPAQTADSDEVEFEIEVENDVPPEDRNRKPVDKKVIDALEDEDLEKFNNDQNAALKEAKKVYHQERREKDAAIREQIEAVNLAKKVLEENKKLKERLQNGETVYVDAVKHSALQELEAAKKEFKLAYESGDADGMLEAQDRMTNAKFKVDKAENYQPQYQKASQQEDFDVQIQQPQVNAPDSKAVAWQKQNDWFGSDEEMTSLALGLHEKLVRSGVPAGSDEYYKRIDNTMRKRFPENFEEEEVEVEEPAKAAKPKASTVVAPATRSTSPKKIRISKTQVALAKKLGLTPEQYARELTKLEAQNG
jgi:predicted nucleic acid-binding protein